MIVETILVAVVNKLIITNQTMVEKNSKYKACQLGKFEFIKPEFKAKVYMFCLNSLIVALGCIFFMIVEI